MKALQRGLAILSVGLSFGAIMTIAAEPAVSEEPKPCIQYWGEVRYVIGYDQYVHLLNSCDKTAHCTVSTDVNPKPQSVDVVAKGHTVVTTWLGSPYATFVPIVSCSMDE